MPYGITPVNFTPYYIYIRVENAHSTDMQEVTAMEVPSTLTVDKNVHSYGQKCPQR